MWRIEFDPRSAVLSVRLVERVSPSQLRKLAAAHAEALEATAGQPFKVLLDLRGLFPFETDAVGLFAEIKSVAASLDGFRGIAVLADSATVAMQQHRTRVTAGDREIVSLNEAEVWRFLAD